MRATQNFTPVWMDEGLDDEIERIAQNDRRQKDIFITRWEQISPASVSKLLESLKLNSFCSHVSFEWISQFPYKMLSKAILSNTCITTLILRDIELGDKGLGSIKKALHNNNTIKNLALSNVGAKNHKLFAEIIGFNVIEEFNISFNDIQSKGMKAIARVLEGNTALLNLNMYCNAIGVDGAIYLGSALGINNTLKILNIGCNNIKHCPDILITSLATCALQEFDCSGNLCGSEDCEKLDESIIANPSIKEATYSTVYIKASDRLIECLLARRGSEASEQGI